MWNVSSIFDSTADEDLAVDVVEQVDRQQEDHRPVRRAAGALRSRRARRGGLRQRLAGTAVDMPECLALSW